MITNTETSPRFAVCLAAYNGTAYIAEQVDSILHQINVHVQIFMSVDRSSDGTEDLLVSWAAREARLTLLPLGQRFGGAAPNFYRLLREVELAGFDYVSLADQDDVWDEGKLWRAHCVLHEQDAVGYSSNFTAFWPSGAEKLINKAQSQRRWDFMFESAGPGCTYVVRADLGAALQQLVREADASLLRVDYHDWLIYAYARFHNLTWVIDHWSSMQYRQHANNQVGVNAGWRPFWSRVSQILGGYGFDQARLIAGVLGATSMPIIQRGLLSGRLGYLWLALRAVDCRRKRLHQVFFFISCLLLAANPLPSRSRP